jgi:hypothetical protein
MRCVVCAAVIPLLMIGCAANSDADKPEPPAMSIGLLEPTQLPHSRYRLTAMISNFDPAAGLQGKLEYHSALGQTIVPISAVTDARIAIETDSLPAAQLFSATILLDGAPGTRQLLASRQFTTGGPDAAAPTAPIGDAATFTVTAYGLGAPIGLYLGVHPTAGAAEQLIQIFGGSKVDDMTYKAVMPVVLSTDQAPVFPGAVQPARLVMRYFNGNAAVDYPVTGEIQLAYRSGKPNPASGTAGSTFELTLFHPAKAPDLSGVTVLFDDTPLAPTSVTELGDITAGGFIYLTRSKFTVPANATLGVHKVTAKTAFDDPFISNGPDFTVTAPAQ